MENPDQKTPWRVSDVHFAVEELLSDPFLDQWRRNDLMGRIVELCAASPRVLPKIWASRSKHSGLDEWKRISTTTAALATGHPDLPKFEAWLKHRSEDFGKGLPVPEETPLLSRNQRNAWDILEKTSALHFSGKCRQMRIQPRTSVSIAGPSGAGKSHLVRAFACHKKLPCLKLTYGDWIPAGAKNSQPTQERISDFLTLHERGLIVIDELDKMHDGLRSEWSTAIMNDLFALLDRTLFTAQGIAENNSQRFAGRLKDGIFIVGCGTWQHLWNVSGGAQRKIGFGTAGEDTAMSTQIRAARSIAPELLNRFSPDLILLEPMSRSDFDALISSDNLGPLAARAEVTIDLEDAVASGLGMRWLEALSLRIHLTLQSEQASAI